MVITSGKNSQSLSNTETLAFDSNTEPPIYPDHPRKIVGSTGGFLHQDFITCGGLDSVEGTTNKCYMLGSEGSFATMMTERRWAASIILEPGKLWILGGKKGQNTVLSTTEYIFSDGRNEEGPQMPIAVSHHAVVKINDTTSFLVGGYTLPGKSKRTWYYDGNWVDGPNLQRARDVHSVGIIRDSVTDQVYLVVAGGITWESINDVDIIDLQENKWEQGKLLYL